MVATDTSTGRALGGILANGETKEECKEFLQELDVLLPFPPILFTIDFSSNLKGAIQSKYPDAIISHDYFHASKLLNKGLLKEMTRKQYKNFNKPIKNYRKARKKSIEAEKNGLIPSYEIGKNDFILKAWDVFKKIFALYNVNSLDNFKNKWNMVLTAIKASDWSKKDELFQEMIKIIPNCGFSSKNYEKMPKKVGRLWRKIIREERKKFEDRKSNFIKAKYTILMNPSNMEKFNKIKLREYLKDYPWLRPIREAISDFHYQFKAPRSSWRSISFLKKIVNEDSHTDLKSAINTLIENKGGLFAYRRIWDDYPHLRGNYGIRSNHEQVNRKINMVARNQFGLRDTSSARLRLEGVLGCPVIVSKHLLAFECKHL